MFDDETTRQILVKTTEHIGKEVHQSKISGKGDLARFELQNKKIPLSAHQLQ